MGFGRLAPLLDFFDALTEKRVVVHFLGGHVEALLPQYF